MRYFGLKLHTLFVFRNQPKSNAEHTKESSALMKPSYTIFLINEFLEKIIRDSGNAVNM